MHTIDSIGGDLWIYENDVLENIEGLENISPETIQDLNIYNNPLLSDCAISSICEYLLSPNGFVYIYGNASGCNNQPEVEQACLETGTENPEFDGSQLAVVVCSNPFDGEVKLEYFTGKESIVQLFVYDLVGRQLALLVNETQLPGKHELFWDASTLPEGIYYYRLKAGKDLKSGKIVLMK